MRVKLPIGRIRGAGLAWLLALLGAASLHGQDRGESGRLVEVRADRGTLVLEVGGARREVTLAGVRWGGPVAPDDALFASAILVHTLQFLGQETERPFTVWGEAGVGSQPSAARITLHSGEDLSEAMVREGLAVAADPGDARLAGLEREARFKGRARWLPEERRRKYIVFYQPSARQELAGNALRATETADLMARAGQLTTVRGVLSRTGSSPSGHLTFLNFQGVERGGFSVIVRRENLPAMTAAMADFPAGLTGREVEISGVISLHRDAPQIELRTPDQLRFP
jgi:hypothetical protein